MAMSSDEPGVFRARCNDCDWTFERRLDKAGLGTETNLEIGNSVTRHHEYNCGENGEKEPGVIEQSVDQTGVVADD